MTAMKLSHLGFSTTSVSSEPLCRVCHDSRLMVALTLVLLPARYTYVSCTLMYSRCTRFVALLPLIWLCVAIYGTDIYPYCILNFSQLNSMDEGGKQL